MTDPLIAFLRARLDEDAQIVRWARDISHVARQGGYAVSIAAGDAAYVAHYGRDRAVRSIAAKRAAVDEAAYWHDKVLADEPHPMPSLADRVVVTRAMLCALATEWSDHPDYDPAWVGSA